MLNFLRLVPVMFATLALPVQAGWSLDNDSSRLSFTTSSNAERAEVHRFVVLKGKVDDQGLAQVDVELDSVSTGNARRDEQLREHLFDIKRTPGARIQARLTLAPLLALAPGAQMEMRLPVTVALRGKPHTYKADLLVTRLDHQRFQVVTLEPLVVQADDFGLAQGFETLRKHGALAALNLAVPVGAVLIFAAN
ncbi:YceI family protein [Pseudomonas syringae]|nr:YceI family protein [Pseudomonas syringae]MBD8573463.1 YceI family protein [Pseudomonas syringae]MBD8790084.1 YceI family protein [Pseudomonas syringae]MBD8800059.1 YceI family protein [Pseudomonas syringae]MBD8810945.1 YceI family protein [Pseudomonas syringae]